MKKKGICALFAATAFSAQALEWPVSQPEILSLFGQWGEGGIERGIVMEGDSTVRAAGDGIVLIAIEEGRNMAGFPSTLGNAVLLAHDDGIVSVYGNLESARTLAGRGQAETGEVIARAGKSAWQGDAAQRLEEGRGICIFQVADQRQVALLNPLLLLPPAEDTVRPSIRDVLLETEAGQAYSLSTTRNVASGSYRVRVAVSDFFAARSHELAPFGVTVIVNGREASSVSFDIMSKKQNVLAPNSTPQYFDENVPIYSDDGAFYAGNISLSRGRTEVTVTARDFAGNDRASSFMLQVE